MRNLEYAYLGDSTGIALTHRGHKILVYTKDLGLTPHLVVHGIWERAIEEAVLRLTPVDGTVVEVGCNMGYHTLAMCEKLGPQGRLFGFEANPEIFRLLRWTIDLNGFASRATLLNVAATHEAGPVSFQFDRSAVGGGNVVSGTANPSNVLIEIAGFPLDEKLADLPSIDLLRMDAEGFEPFVLRGARKLIERSPRMAIVTEWSTVMMGARTSVPDLIELLGAMGFSAWRIESDASFSPVAMRDLSGLDHCEIAFCRHPLPQGRL